MQKAKLFPSSLAVLASYVFLYLRAAFIVSPDQILRSLLVTWLVLLLLSWPACRLTRDSNWAGILLLVIVLGFFSRGIFALIYSVTVLSILLLLWLVYKLLKRKLLFDHVFFTFNLVSLAALMLSVAVLYPQFQAIPASYYSNYKSLRSSNNSVMLNAPPAGKPDIYYIVLDGYGRADMLQELYQYDNSTFIAYLKQQGFTVPGNSHSNYPKTVLSVTSTLNMDYVESFAPQLQQSDFWWLLSPWLDHSLVRNSLEKIGYTSVSSSTNWSISDNPTTDIYFKSHPLILTDFERYLLGVTPLKILEPMLNTIASIPTFDTHRDSQLYGLDALKESATLSGPKFVYAHIILPHPPFVLSSDGTPITPDYPYSLNDASDYVGTELQYRDQYVGQLEFLNRKLEIIIESILENSNNSPIIILQADHGPGMLTDFTSSANTCLAERFSPFAAYYLPEADPGIIPDNITPVNLFRIIFNEYFDADLPLLENAYYYPRQAIHVYDLEDVTDVIDRTENCSPPVKSRTR